MYPKTEMEAIRMAHNLYETWVGHVVSVGVDMKVYRLRSPMLDAIRASIRSEMQANRESPARATAANKRETLRDLRIVSYIANHYPRVGSIR